MDSIYALSLLCALAASVDGPKFLSVTVPTSPGTFPPPPATTLGPGATLKPPAIGPTGPEPKRDSEGGKGWFKL